MIGSRGGPPGGQNVDALLDAGRQAGFAAVGVASCGPSAHAERLDAWLRRGAHGGMAWMAETAGVRKDLRTRWTWARSALVGAASYFTEPRDRRELRGLGRLLSRYAWGRDYHDEVKARLRTWARALEPWAGRPVRRVLLVDTSAVLEREMASRAGIGWFGKNTCLIGPRGDSWRFLGLALTDLDLPSTGPVLPDRCGTCRACIDACPTGAITEPWFVDARRCISYLTIEHRGPIPEEFHSAIGDWLFGCDVCQDVCPHNRRMEATDDPVFAPDRRYSSLSLADLLKMDVDRFRSTFRGTPLSRPRRSGLLRNALIVAANTADEEASAAARTLAGDPDPTIRETLRQLAAKAPGRGAAGASCPDLGDR